VVYQNDGSKKVSLVLAGLLRIYLSSPHHTAGPHHHHHSYLGHFSHFIRRIKNINTMFLLDAVFFIKLF